MAIANASPLGTAAPHRQASVRRSSDPDRIAVTLTFLLMPATFYQGEIAGFRATGVAWFVLLCAGLYALAVRPIRPRSMRYATPYLFFLVFALISLLWAPDLVFGIQTLASFTTVIVIYLVAWRAGGDDPELMLKLRRWASWLLPTAMLLFGQAILTTGGLTTQGARPAAMSIALLLVLATYRRSRRATLLISAAVLAYNIGAGSRMGTVVVVLLILFSPSIGFTRRHQLAIAGVAFAVFLALIPTAAFQSRWFVGNQPGTFTDIIQLGPNFNTAGRGENWPAILAKCSERPVLGSGIGSASPITNEINPKSNHPHNEYLRAYCDGGLVAGSSFWLFFLMVGARAVAQLAVLARRHETGAAHLAVLVIMALVLFASTDNITIYTIQYMAPAAVIFALSDRAFAGQRVVRAPAGSQDR